MFTGAFKSASEIMVTPPTFLPIKPTLENVSFIFSQANILGRMYLNSAIVSIIIPILQTIVCVPAAYSFAKLKFPGRNLLFLLFMSAMMLPTQMTMITNFSTMVSLKLLNNLLSLVLLGMFSALAIFMMRQYFMGLPKDLDEAAKIDGCGVVRTLLHVGMPLALPIISVNLILCFNGIWGDFFAPMLMLRDIKIMTLPVGMTVFQGAYNTQSRAVLVCALAMSIIPVVVVYFLFRKQLVAGIATSGLKL